MADSIPLSDLVPGTKCPLCGQALKIIVDKDDTAVASVICYHPNCPFSAQVGFTIDNKSVVKVSFNF